LSIRTSCEQRSKDGAGTIPAKKLLELVRLLPEGEIKVRLLENHWVEIVSDKKKYKLVAWQKRISLHCLQCRTRWLKSPLLSSRT